MMITSNSSREEKIALLFRLDTMLIKAGYTGLAWLTRTEPFASAMRELDIVQEYDIRFDALRLVDGELGRKFDEVWTRLDPNKNGPNFTEAQKEELNSVWQPIVEAWA